MIKLQKECEKLHSILSQLKEKGEKLESKIEAREDSFNDKSEKWQESDAGIAHEEKTQELQDFFDEFTSKIETIEFEIEELMDLENYKE